jgi:hypothetical protein
MKIQRLPIYALLFALVLVFSGCANRIGVRASGHSTPRHAPVVVAPAPGPGHGPPPWAPAHGHRAKHKYRYYPSYGVYFEPVRNVWFYLEGANWRVGAQLPGSIHLGSATYISLEMDVGKPYLYHGEVVKKHPPKKHKKKGKGKGKGKNKWKNKG